MAASGTSRDMMRDAWICGVTIGGHTYPTDKVTCIMVSTQQTFADGRTAYGLRVPGLAGKIAPRDFFHRRQDYSLTTVE